MPDTIWRNVIPSTAPEFLEITSTILMYSLKHYKSYDKEFSFIILSMCSVIVCYVITCSVITCSVITRHGVSFQRAIVQGLYDPESCTTPRDIFNYFGV